MNFNYREELKNYFGAKKAKNPVYSLRAFARDLSVSVTALSDVLAGKRNFSHKNAQKVSEKLCFSPAQYQKMLFEINQRKVIPSHQQEILQIKEDEFRLISKWYNIAILTLSQQEKVPASASKIAKRLGISTKEATHSIAILKRLNLLEMENNILKRTSLPLRTTTDIPSYAIRNYHKEHLELVRSSLDNVPVEMREICSMSLNIDPTKIKKAKDMINKFKEEFTLEMEKTAPKEVYNLALHFYPTKITQENL
ncbi:MAG: DUF4423 domain-containing protein [Halobacteriovoraceae bacterium]|jgi:uncharacterized protein (TIGR02147 family)|nr:DUF4423 domain-containing protein [Halobacteriovoraceae bacterium]